MESNESHWASMASVCHAGPGSFMGMCASFCCHELSQDFILQQALSSTKSDLCPFSSKVWTSSKGGAAELILVYNFQACLGLAGVARQPKPLASSYLDCWGLWHSLVGGIAPKQKAGEALLTSPSVTPANSNAFQRH